MAVVRTVGKGEDVICFIVWIYFYFSHSAHRLNERAVDYILKYFFLILASLLTLHVVSISRPCDMSD